MLRYPSTGVPIISGQPSPNLSTEIFTVLKDRIIRWQYASGHRFTEEGLCEEFGVSRSPVREALRMLVENDLVEKAPYKSYSVKQPDLQEIQELYDVRLASKHLQSNVWWSGATHKQIGKNFIVPGKIWGKCPWLDRWTLLFGMKSSMKRLPSGLAIRRYCSKSDLLMKGFISFA